MAESLRRYTGDPAVARRLPPVPGTIRPPARDLQALLLLALGRGHARHDRPAQELQSVHAGRRPDTAHGNDRCRHHPAAGEGWPRCADAGPFHPVRRLVAVRVTGGVVLHRAYADRWRRLVSARRHPSRRRGLDGARTIASARVTKPAAAIDRIETADGRVSAIIADDGERIPVSAVVSNMDSVRTYRDLIGGAAGRGVQQGPPL